MRGVKEPTGATPPEWMYAIAPGTFDRRVLDQRAFWVTKAAQILPVRSLTRPHLANILTMLEAMAPVLHVEALADIIASEHTAGFEIELLLYWLTGNCLATVSPRDWLGTTPLVRAMRDQLATR